MTRAGFVFRCVVGEECRTIIYRLDVWNNKKYRAESIGKLNKREDLDIFPNRDKQRSWTQPCWAIFANLPFLEKIAEKMVELWS